MSTVLVTRPTPGTPDPARTPRRSRGLVRRVGALRHTSPGRLQLILTALITLGLLTGLVAGLTGRATSAATTELANRNQPLLVEAETIYSGLADANTTANQAFLSGGLEPPELTRRYDADLTQATTALASAAGRTTEGSDAAAAISALTSGLPQYSALVATARANNRQGKPVGSSYLSAASALNESLLAQAQALFRIAQSQVNDSYGTARATGWLIGLFLLLLALLLALVVSQRYLSRTTRRTFNVALVTATVFTLVLAAASGGLLANQHTHLRHAEADGSAPAAQIAEARILALRERGDEALTLAAHSSDKQDSKFTVTDGELTTALGNSFLPAATGTAYSAYVTLHRKIRGLDTDGDYEGAVDLAVGPDTTTAFEKFNSDLGTALTQRKAAFADQIGQADTGLDWLTALGPLLALIICGLAAAGIRARLEEYR